ncbi:NAD(P)H-binding protein [Micromonospora sp. C28SCA-DRY-2]|uniref:NmrA family NAD(P)-binding protein n=1 Tax=Micromonospora sp. C28SCA-DRY-2 TaxID=3059522 RepID=UPI002676FC4C|nr:NAD(P)H-binding protein [Micromonospora sp. C28SCA-DRY-2]MDO3704787.1 NAD(P)H-binding protein [Micromonospora sp. C28SCA-DRY-2]
MIVVTGAAGQIGRALIGQLDRRGVRRRAVVRQHRQGAELGGSYVVGDFDDPDSIRKALEPGARLLLNSSLGPDFVRQQRKLVDLAAEAGVAHVVKVSVRGATPGGLLGLGMHGEVEAHLKRSGLAWSILQPVGFMQNLFTEVAFDGDEQGRFHGSYGPGRVGYIDARDVAEVAAVLLTRPVGDNETLVLTGSEAPTHEEIGEVLTRTLGRPVRYVDLTVPAMAERLRAAGMPAAAADDLATLMRLVGDGRWASTTGAVRELTGRPPRTLADFVTAHADRFR